MVNKYSKWECPDCKEIVLAPELLDKDTPDEFIIKEIKHKCNTNLEDLGKEWWLFPLPDCYEIGVKIIDGNKVASPLKDALLDYWKNELVKKYLKGEIIL